MITVKKIQTDKAPGAIGPYNHGCIIAAGKHHTLHQHFDAVLAALGNESNGRTFVNQIQFITCGDDCFRIQILQRYVGGEELCDAGGEELSAGNRLAVADRIRVGIVDQNLPGLHGFRHLRAGSVNGGLRIYHITGGLRLIRYGFRWLGWGFCGREGFHRRWCRGWFRSRNTVSKGQQQGNHKNSRQSCLRKPYSHDYPSFFRESL